MTSSSRSYAVLGAGALGLTAALRLAQNGHAVTVYEREPLPGGLAAGFPLGRSHLEKFYHHLFRTDSHAVDLIRELGLSDRLTWRKPPTVVLRDGRLWRLDSGASVLRFDPLPMTDRVRMGGALAYLKLSPNRFEGKTAARWLRRTMGPRAFDTVWEPLLTSKFGDRHDEIALPWFWARVHYRTARLGYLSGGFQQLYDSLTRKVVGLGSRVELGTAVEAVEPRPQGFAVHTSAQTERFDFVVSTLPARVTATLVRGLPASYLERYAATEALGAMCLVLALDRPLTDAYWINVNDPGFAFQPVVEHTNFVPAADYGGRHIVYLGNYLPMTHPYFSAGAEHLLAEFTPGLRRLNPEFDSTWLRDVWLFKAPFAQPIVTTGYGDRIPPHVTPIPGLYLANMFQVYPQDRGQNYSIALAERLVRLIDEA